MCGPWWNIALVLSIMIVTRFHKQSGSVQTPCTTPVFPSPLPVREVIALIPFSPLANNQCLPYSFSGKGFRRKKTHQPWDSFRWPLNDWRQFHLIQSGMSNMNIGELILMSAVCVVYLFFCYNPPRTEHWHTSEYGSDLKTVIVKIKNTVNW